MCGPWAIPLALTLGGSVAQYFGDKQSQHARESSFMAERQRQQGLEDQQTARFNDSLAKTQDMLTPASQDAAAKAREGTLAAAIVPPSSTSASYLPGSSSAPSVVATATDKASETGKQTSLSLAHSLAALGGTTDQLQNLNTGIGRNSQQIDQLSGFRRGSSGVLDSEMQAANHKGDFLRGVGGLAQSIGQAWLGSSMGGGGVKFDQPGVYKLPPILTSGAV